MKRKLLYLLLSFFVVFLSFPLTNKNQQASAEAGGLPDFDCNIADPEQITFNRAEKITGVSTFQVSIDDPGKELDEGATYSIEVFTKPPGQPLGGDIHFVEFYTVQLIDRKIVLDVTPYNKRDNKIIEANTLLSIGLLTADRRQINGDRKCNINFYAPADGGGGGGGGGGNPGLCDIKLGAPPPGETEQQFLTRSPNKHKDVTFHVGGLIEGLDGQPIGLTNGKPTDTRGVLFIDLSTSPPTTLSNECRANNNLTTGYTVGNTSDKWSSGKYSIEIHERCTAIFGFESTSDGPLWCQKNIRIDANGDIIAVDNNVQNEGDPCDPSSPPTNPDTKVNTEQCPDTAKYCVIDNRTPGHFACSHVQPIQDKCTGGVCKTAIGDIGYDPQSFVKSVLSLVLSLAGGILLLFIILTGYRLMVSQGDPEKVKEAKESLTSAVVGLLFIIASLVILQFITVDVLQIPGFTP